MPEQNTEKQNREGWGKMESPKFTIGCPGLLMHKNNPEAIIGGYALRINNSEITISYENPLASVSKDSRVAMNSGYRNYNLNVFGKYEIFKDIKMKPFENSLVGKLDIRLEDFICLGINQNHLVCGFILEITPEQLLLSHQNPVLSDEFYTSSGNYPRRLKCRKEITIGTRRYNLSHFNSFSVLFGPSNRENQEDILLNSEP